MPSDSVELSVSLPGGHQATANAEACVPLTDAQQSFVVGVHEDEFAHGRGIAYADAYMHVHEFEVVVLKKD